jgi:hypothetical protein
VDFQYYFNYGISTAGTYAGKYCWGDHRISSGTQLSMYYGTTFGSADGIIVSNGDTDQWGDVNDSTLIYFNKIMAHMYPAVASTIFNPADYVCLLGGDGRLVRFRRDDLSLVSGTPIGLTYGKGMTVAGDYIYTGSVFILYRIHTHTLAVEAVLDFRDHATNIPNAAGISDCASDGTYMYTVNYTYPFVAKWRISDWSYVAKWGSGAYYDSPRSVGDGTWWPWSPDSGMAFPEGVTTDGEYIWVSDTGNHDIVKLRCSDMSYVARWGKRYYGVNGLDYGFSGEGNGEFSNPWQIASTRPGTQGDLIVADMGNSRLQRITKEGVYVSKFGSWGQGTDQFDVASGVATDGTYIYVYDSYYPRLKKHLISDLSYIAHVPSQNGNSGLDIGYLYGQSCGICTIEDALDPFPTKGRGYIIG